MSLSNPSTQSSGNLMEERKKELGRKKEWRTPKEQGLLNHSAKLIWTDEAEAVCTEPAWTCTRPSGQTPELPVQYFHGTPECGNKCFSDSCDFSLWSYVSVCYTCPILMWWVLFYLIWFLWERTYLPCILHIISLIFEYRKLHGEYYRVQLTNLRAAL